MNSYNQPPTPKNPFKWAVLGVGSFIAIAHLGVLGHIMKANQDTMRQIANRPNYPNINLPTGQYSSYDVNVDRDGYSLRYNANDPKTFTTSRSTDIDKTHDDKGWFGKTSKGALTKSETVIQEYSMHGGLNAGADNPVGKSLSAEDLACIKSEGAGESTGGMIGASMTAGVAPMLTGIPYVGWLAAGWASLLGRNVGSDLGAEISKTVSGC